MFSTCPMSEKYLIVDPAHDEIMLNFEFYHQKKEIHDVVTFYQRSLEFEF